MARTLQLLEARWLRNAVLFLVTIALWQVAGCVIPPQEVVATQNHLPYINWELVIPTDNEFTLSKAATGVTTTFSIEEAAVDPDGDPIETHWYWSVEGKLPHYEQADKSMTLDSICLLHQDARDAKEIIVEVAISDQPGAMKFERKLDEEPVDPGVDDQGNELPLIKFAWVITLLDNCP